MLGLPVELDGCSNFPLRVDNFETAASKHRCKAARRNGVDLVQQQENHESEID